MSKKSESKPMKEILTRIQRDFEHIETIVFPEESILKVISSGHLKCYFNFGNPSNHIIVVFNALSCQLKNGRCATVLSRSTRKASRWTKQLLMRSFGNRTSSTILKLSMRFKTGRRSTPFLTRRI